MKEKKNERLASSYPWNYASDFKRCLHENRGEGAKSNQKFNYVNGDVEWMNNSEGKGGEQKAGAGEGNKCSVKNNTHKHTKEISYYCCNHTEEGLLPTRAVRERVCACMCDCACRNCSVKSGFTLWVWTGGERMITLDYMTDWTCYLWARHSSCYAI